MPSPVSYGRCHLGWLLGHYAVRYLMFQAVTQAGLSPLGLRFTGSLKVIGRAFANFQYIPSEQVPFLLQVNPGNYRVQDSPR